MSRYTVTLRVGQTQTRLLLTHETDEMMRLALPPPSPMHSCQCVPALLQSIALWLDQPLHVVLSVAAAQRSLCLGLTDALGCGIDSVFYTVQVLERGVRRRRGRRLRGVGDFRRLHLLQRAAQGGGAS